MKSMFHLHLQENGRRQKSKVCEMFDHLFSLLEERKGEMTQQITAEQEEKLEYIRGLRRRYNEHLENTAKLLETAIQSMDESEMAVFLQVSRSSVCESRRAVTGVIHTHLLIIIFVWGQKASCDSSLIGPSSDCQAPAAEVSGHHYTRQRNALVSSSGFNRHVSTRRITEGTNTSHLDKLQPGYENMEHFSADFDRQRRALMNVDFIKREEHRTSQRQNMSKC